MRRATNAGATAVDRHIKFKETGSMRNTTPRRVTFFVTSSTGAPVRRLTVSKRTLWIAGVAAFVCLVAAVAFLADYSHLRRTALKARHLSKMVADQDAELSRQEARIQDFVSQVNELKSRLVVLHQFEQKIRVIANMENDAEGGNLFGVGGAIPDEIGPAAALEESRSAMLREMHAQLNVLDTAFSMQKDNFSSLLDYLEDKRKLLASSPAIRPINGGWITSRFEYRKSPFTGRREFHQGLDIAARVGTPVVATADGVVLFSGRKGSLGNAVMIDHGNGVITRYGHLHECFKKRGETVSREDVVGSVGNTGISTGPHLHYEVRINGVAVNPEKYILN